jgi:hypothetical protein
LALDRKLYRDVWNYCIDMKFRSLSLSHIIPLFAGLLTNIGRKLSTTSKVRHNWKFFGRKYPKYGPRKMKALSELRPRLRVQHARRSTFSFPLHQLKDWLQPPANLVKNVGVGTYDLKFLYFKALPPDKSGLAPQSFTVRLRQP